jgi:peptidoglycan/xylan/chitin deacetylase (PgdA/CDA1 family)
MRGRLCSGIVKSLEYFLTHQRVHLSAPGGMASFTFDDFPQSAFAIGGTILEKYNARGTYYASLGLASTAGDLGPMFDFEDIAAANLRGHEIACHTYSHMDCSRTNVKTILGEIEKNATTLNRVVEGTKTTNFAYPFGRTSIASRRALRSRFTSCRGIRPGINRSFSDLTNLRAVRIYDRTIDEVALKQVIDRSCTLGGWIIFYTHDVAVAPSAFGCTPSQLEGIVAYAASRMPILPVRDALTRALAVH